MIRFVSKLKTMYSIYLVFKNLPFRQRTSILRMLYWITHSEEIPKSEFNKLLDDKWFIKCSISGGYRWSEEGNSISILFEEL